MTTAEHPSARPALATLREARRQFLMGRRLPDDVPEDIAAAWRRARFLGVRHDVRDPAPRHSVRPAPSSPLAAVRPVLERIAPALDSGRASLVLTDERLRVRWSTGFAPVDLRHLDLSEQVVGNNSAAHALRTGRRAEVHGPEHFLDLWQDICAVSVPVRAPGNGQALGTVTVASRLCAECGPHPGAPLAEAAAIAVEAELLAGSQAAERVLLDAYLRAAGERGRAVVALDGRSRLVSEAAGRLLSPEALEELERRTIDLLRNPDHWARPGAGTETGAAWGSRGSTGGAAASCRFPFADGSGGFATVTPVPHLGSVVGAVAVLEAAGQTVEAAGQPVAAAGPAVVGLVGRSLPWRHAVGRAMELARSPEPLLLVGERGTGKISLARKLVTNPSVVDAAESEIRSELGELTEGGRPLLVRHVERLTPPDTAALNSLLEAHPGAPLVVTYTPGPPPGPCLQRFLDTLAARSVTLPALRERTEDIRDLLAALAPPPAPGRPPLTWTLDALRALERHPWPGNLTELSRVVRALAETRSTTGPVRRAELPDSVREGPAARRLSPMEHAERAAILEALHRHGGNKARTATALGIARATLYRKLRGYQSHQG
ncbi:helix-turn-helix domain-containing protein [Streptomyces sp. NPDC005263]|uniref:helix-turn-helix domain-containing protein n=1 Tax=Streptomyces sp. NPDC005263 TaxID=3364711 RepID=UPI0036C443AD